MSESARDMRPAAGDAIMTESKRDEHAGKLLAALAMLRRDASHCDVLLQAETAVSEAAGEVVGESRGVWAHRAVLAAASPYFNTMFLSSFKVCTKLVLVIQDVKLDILRALVENIYLPSALMMTVEDAKELLTAATMLDVEDVRNEACVLLSRSLTVENVLGIQASAELHDCSALAASATRYIREHIELVLEGDELLKLAPNALIELIYSNRLAVCEERKFYAVLRWTQHRPQARRQHLSTLLRAVRLSSVPRSVLATRVRTEPLAGADSRALIQVIQALAADRHHLESSSPAANTPCLPQVSQQTQTYALFVIGGWTSHNMSSSVLFCPLPNGPWQYAAPLPEERSAAGAVFFDGCVYVVVDSAVNTVFVYNPAVGSWSTGPPMTSDRAMLGLAALGGRLYAVGGAGSAGDSAEALDPRDGVWRRVAPLVTRRSRFNVATLDGMLYAVGGDDGKRTLRSTERYDPTADRWETVEDMANQRMFPGVGVVNDSLYAVGGRDGWFRLHRSVERYRVGQGWEPSTPLAVGRDSVAVVSHDDLLYTIGGNYYFSSSPIVSVFDPATEAWRELPALPAGRAAPAVIIPWPSMP